MHYLLRFNPISGASVITSIFIHLMFFVFIILSFPVKFQHHQPYLISLGAIIPHEDLLQAHSNDRLQPKEEFQPLGYSKQKEGFSSLRQLDKPSNQNLLKLNGKISPKSAFPATKQSTIINNTELLKLKNDLDPYQPLQIP